MSNLATVEQLKQIRAELDAAIALILKGHPGMTLVTGNCKYTHDNSFTFKLEGILPGGKSREASDYEMVAQWRGLPPLGTPLTISGRRVVIVGLRNRAKYDILVAIEGTDKRTCYKSEDIKRIWAEQNPPA